jgi:hypothetical protein
VVTPAARRETVAHLQEHFTVSERCACRLVGVARSTVRYQPQPREDAKLIERLHLLARQPSVLACWAPVSARSSETSGLPLDSI